MTNKHSIKHRYTRIFLVAAGMEVTEDSINEHKKLWWWNWRDKNEGGLRLTEEGENFIKNNTDIKTYQVDFPEEFSVTPQVLLWLDRYIDSPFFITIARTPKSKITVLHERAAFELYMFSGDILKLGHNKAINKQLSQD